MREIITGAMATLIIVAPFLASAYVKAGITDEVRSWMELVYFSSQSLVVLGVWYAYMQFRSSRTAAQETQYAAYSASFQEFQTLIATNADLANLVIRGGKGLGGLSDEDRERYGALLSKSLESIYVFNQMAESWRPEWKPAVAEMVRSQFGSAGAQEWWATAKTSWSDDANRLLAGALQGGAISTPSLSANRNDSNAGP